jgi:hypothetical protein
MIDAMAMKPYDHKLVLVTVGDTGHMTVYTTYLYGVGWSRDLWQCQASWSLNPDSSGPWEPAHESVHQQVSNQELSVHNRSVDTYSIENISERGEIGLQIVGFRTAMAGFAMDVR